jgi:hypothetical protein
MKTKKVGRPKLPKKKVMGAVITIRLTPAERKAIGRAVERSGEKLSKWARAALMDAARANNVVQSEDAGIEPHGVSAPQPLDVKPS